MNRKFIFLFFYLFLFFVFAILLKRGEYGRKKFNYKNMGAPNIR